MVLSFNPTSPIHILHLRCSADTGKKQQGSILRRFGHYTIKLLAEAFRDVPFSLRNTIDCVKFKFLRAFSPLDSHIPK
jgi:hypothetical protein